jgi:hypothetical protein
VSGRAGLPAASQAPAIIAADAAIDRGEPLLEHAWADIV